MDASMTQHDVSTSTRRTRRDFKPCRKQPKPRQDTELRVTSSMSVTPARQIDGTTYRCSTLELFAPKVIIFQGRSIIFRESIFIFHHRNLDLNVQKAHPKFSTRIASAKISQKRFLQIMSKSLNRSENVLRKEFLRNIVR